MTGPETLDRANLQARELKVTLGDLWSARERGEHVPDAKLDLLRRRLEDLSMHEALAEGD